MWGGIIKNLMLVLELILILNGRFDIVVLSFRIK